MEKEFIVKVEQEFKVTLDMHKYNNNILKHISGYWNYDSDFTNEEIIEEAVRDIVGNFLNRGYHDEKLEGFPIDGQKCERIDTHVYIEEYRYIIKNT